MSQLGKKTEAGATPEHPSGWMDKFHDAWGSKSRCFAVPAKEGEPLSQLLGHYPFIVSVFWKLCKSMMVVTNSNSTSGLHSMFTRKEDQALVVKIEMLRERLWVDGGSSALAGHLGLLRSCPRVLPPLDSGSDYHADRREQKRAVTRFFLESIRANQKDVVLHLLAKYHVTAELWEGSCIDDPVYAAVVSDQAEMADLLLTHANGGAGVLRSSNNAGDAGSMSCGMTYYAIEEAASTAVYSKGGLDKEKDLACLKVLLKHYKSRNLKAGTSPEVMAMTKAVESSGKLAEEVVELMLSAGFDVNAKHRGCCGKTHRARHSGLEGTTALHRACKIKHQGMIDLLVKHGADWEAQDSKGNTPKDFFENPECSDTEAPKYRTISWKEQQAESERKKKCVVQ